MGNDINTDLLKNMMMGGGIKESSNKSYNNKRNHSGNGNSRNNRDNSRSNNRNNNRNNNGNHNNYNNRTSSYIGNPYNFVGFSQKVYEYPQDKLTLHSDMKDELFTGELTYEVEAKTKIIVDDGKGSFYKNPEGNYAIPASTMRGLIRNNVQILGLSSFYDDIEDYALMYRKVTGGRGQDKDKYDDILGAKNNNPELRGIAVNVKAGVIVCEKGEYYIYPSKITTATGANYYMLSARRVAQNVKNYPFLFEEGKNYSMYKKECVFERIEEFVGKIEKEKVTFVLKTEDKNLLSSVCGEHGEFSFEGRKQSKNRVLISKIGKKGEYSQLGEKIKNAMIKYRPKENWMINNKFKPFFEKVNYEVKDSKFITKLDGQQGGNSGYIIASGYMSDKKNMYIIPEVDRENPIRICEEDVKAFRVDYNKKKNQLKDEQFYALPKEGEKEKPVFYIQLGGRLYFGFTPRLRLFYDHTIKEGLQQNHKEGVIDYAKAMFGFTGKPSGYKSKLSFSDAVLVNEPSIIEEQKYMLSEPKPSSYLDYLAQDADNEVTYNTHGFQLRGIKQYWLRNAELPNNIGNGNEKALSKFTPLAAGAKFQGKIRFSNLTKDELGLLLWSVQLREESWMNVGKAKAYGYGNIKVKLQSAKKVDMKKAYATSEFCFDPFEDINSSECIGYYKACMKDYLDGKELETLPSIKEFFDMKNSKIMPDPKKIRYMDINNREYQNRKEPLGQISDYVRNENVSVQNN